MAFIYRSCMIAAALSFSNLIFGQPPGGQMPKVNTASIKNMIIDVAFAKKSEAQKLDIYLPEVGDGPFPVIVQIRGGAFGMGDKADAQVHPSLEGLAHGYAVISIN